MGVNNLWRLLLPIGRRISVETLEGKILAIDASIWLTQFLKAMRDAETGNVRAGAHLVGILRRLCKLRYLGIKPVLVFDGATPEIKKREVARRKRRDQFSIGKLEGENDQTAIQRMAKRLLLSQLQKHGKQAALSNANGKLKVGEVNKKKKRGVALSSAAPGFFDPSTLENENKDDEKMDDDDAENENDSQSNQHDPPDESPTKICQAGSQESSGTIDVDKLLSEGADYLQDENAPTGPSDWDTALDVQNSGDKSDSGNFGAGPATKSNAAVYNPIDGTFDVDYVAALPSLSRTEHVETARRQQRLQSRHEFMKVAANPEALSQCQLRNFLRYSSLNSGIRKMAVQATKLTEGEGFETAADRTKRVIFEKDEDDEKKGKRGDSDSEASFHPSDYEEEEKTFNTRFSNGKKRRRSRNDSEDDDEDDVIWESGEAAPKAIEDSEDDGENVPAASQGGFHKKPPAKKQKPSDGGFLIVGANTNSLAAKNRRVIHVEESDEDGDSEDDGEGGFIPKDNDAKLAQELQDEALARAIQDGDIDDDEGNSGVAALSSSDIRSTIDVASDDDEDNADGFFVAAARKNSRAMQHAQEMVDAQFAHAVQEAEMNMNEETGQEVEVLKASGASQHTEGVSENESERIIDAPKEQEERSSEEDDDIDWEDGDGEENEGDAGPEEEKIEVIKVTFEEPGMEDVETIEPPPTASDKKSPSSPSSNLKSPPPGSVDEKEVLIEEYPEAFFQSPEPKRIAARQKSDDTDDTDIEDDIDHIDDDNGFGSGFGGGDEWGDGRAKAQLGTDTAAALEQAQATAANLTDWAARAFRRAIAHHAEVTGTSPASSKGSPQKKSPSPLKKKPSESTTEAPIADNKNGVAEDGTVVPVLARGVKFQSNRSGSPDKPAGSNKRQDEQHRGPQPSSSPPSVDNGETLANLELYKDKWAAERNQQERDSDMVSDEMQAEAMQLLQLFGVPYVLAPAEAEAQCATLEQLGLVDGIVTEDSDVWVFGGKVVYRNMFDDQKYVEEYRCTDAEREMRLNRNGFVALAMLLGGDYTEGVKGVGIVNGMEILESFEITDDLERGLEGFRKWLDGFDPGDALAIKSKSTPATKEQAFHKNHRTARTRWTCPKSFPDPKVLSAYLNPVVDTSKERFSWGTPDVEQLILFCNKHIGWSPEETRNLVDPVVNRLSSGMRQTRIDSFMRYEDGLTFANVRSKRLKSVLNSIQGNNKKAKSGSKGS